MRLSPRTTAGLVGAVGLAVATAGIVPAVAAPSAPSATWKSKSLATKLGSPKSITLDGKGNVVIAQNGLGQPIKDDAKLAKYYTSGKDKGELKRFGKKRATVAIAHSPTGGYWTLGANATLYWQKAVNTKPKKVRDLRAWAAKHPDPRNQSDGPANESNPFGLAATAKGDALVTDAAANSLLRVSRKGKVTLVARFAPQSVKTDHIPAGERPPGLPASLVTEAVPTGVAVDAKGTIFVGELKGYPFRPKSSHVYKLSSGTKNAVCSASSAYKAKNCKVAHSNLTSIASIAVNPAGGLLVLEYAKAGVGALEAGCFGPAGCPPAVLLKVKGAKRSEVKKGAFSAPGQVIAYGKNKFYVTDRMFTPNGGRLSRLTLS